MTEVSAKQFYEVNNGLVQDPPTALAGLVAAPAAADGFEDDGSS